MSFNGLDGRVRAAAGLATLIIDSLPEVEKEFFEAVVRAVGQRADIDITDWARTDLVIRNVRDGGIDLRSGYVRANAALLKPDASNVD